MGNQECKETDNMPFYMYTIIPKFKEYRNIYCGNVRLEGTTSIREVDAMNAAFARHVCKLYNNINNNEQRSSVRLKTLPEKSGILPEPIVLGRRETNSDIVLYVIACDVGLDPCSLVWYCLQKSDRGIVRGVVISTRNKSMKEPLPEEYIRYTEPLKEYIQIMRTKDDSIPKDDDDILIPVFSTQGKVDVLVKYRKYANVNFRLDHPQGGVRHLYSEDQWINGLTENQRKRLHELYQDDGNHSLIHIVLEKQTWDQMYGNKIERQKETVRYFHPYNRDVLPPVRGSNTLVGNRENDRAQIWPVHLRKVISVNGKNINDYKRTHPHRSYYLEGNWLNMKEQQRGALIRDQGHKIVVIINDETSGSAHTDINRYQTDGWTEFVP